MHSEQKQASNKKVFLRKGTRASQTQKGLWMVTQLATLSKQSPPPPHKAQPGGIWPFCWDRDLHAGADGPGL